ncbi:MFS transporter [Streptomyces sp. 8K308]|nr:MFS transporter [Streptomyces sp. 8K308]
MSSAISAPLNEIHALHPATGREEPRVSSLPPGRTRTLALTAILLAAFIDLIDVTILNVTLPSIQADLDASPAQLQWMLSAYTLALGAGLISGARLGDIAGHRRVFVVGVLGFTAASALRALALNPGMLIASRVAQGLELRYPT